MRRRLWLWIGGILILVVMAVWVLRLVAASSDAAAFQAQLMLARAEGIPTNAQEFKATIPTAAPAENAASLYRQLRGKVRYKTDPIVIDRELNLHPSARVLADARSALEEHRDALRIADQAVLLPRCWFDRDWSKGEAVLFPEYADMKTAAKFLALRGSVAVAMNDDKAALDNMRRLLTVAKHAGEEPHLISHLVREAIYLIGMRDLAAWAFDHREQPAFREALKEALDGFPRPNLKEEHREDLYMILSVIDLSSTPEGRKELGLREQDVGSAERFVPLLLSQSKAKVQIVQAEREYWAALDLQPDKRGTVLDGATVKVNAALLAFPTASKIYHDLGSGDDLTSIREEIWEARRLPYYALLRALGGKEIPRSIKTSDLLSPFDGKPVKYSYDGHQIVIEVSDGGETDLNLRPLKIPPDDGPKQ